MYRTNVYFLFITSYIRVYKLIYDIRPCRILYTLLWYSTESEKILKAFCEPLRARCAACAVCTREKSATAWSLRRHRASSSSVSCKRRYSTIHCCSSSSPANVPVCTVCLSASTWKQCFIQNFIKCFYKKN